MVTIKVNGQEVNGKTVRRLAKQLAVQTKENALKGAAHADKLRGEGVVANTANATKAVVNVGLEVFDSLTSVFK